MGQSFFAGGCLHPALAGITGQFVDHIQIRGVNGDPHFGSDSKSVNWGPGLDNILDHMFIQTAAGKDVHLVQAGGIQLLTQIKGQGLEVAGVDAYAPDLKFCPQLTSQLNDFARALQRVKGVHQQNSLRKGPGKGPEGILFIVVGLDEAVGHGAGYRDIVCSAGQHVARGLYPSQIKASGSLEAGVDAVNTAQAKVNDPFVSGGQGHPGGLGCSQGLDMVLIDHKRL